MGKPVLAGVSRLGTLWRNLRPSGLGVSSSGIRPRMVICLPSEPGAPVSWALSVDGRTQTGSGSLTEVPKEVRHGVVVEVWTPPHETLVTDVQLPTQTRAKVAQALPFALEEQLLGEPEQFQFSYRPLGEGRFAVAVTAKERIKAWQGSLAEAGLSADMMCPANLRLPWMPGDWSIAFEGHEIWVRTGPLSGLAAFRVGGQPPELLVAAVKEARLLGAPERLRLYNPPVEYDRVAWAALGVPIEEASRERCVAPDEPSPFNLLHAAGDGDGDPRLRALRPAAILLALWIVLGLVMHAAQWVRWHTVEARQQRQMLALFRESFPQEKEIVDPMLQMRRGVAELKQRSGLVDGNDLLPLLERLAKAMSGNVAAQIRGLRYHSGRLRLDVDVAGFTALDTLKQRFQSAGLRVKVLTADSTGSRVRGRLEVSSPP